MSDYLKSKLDALMVVLAMVAGAGGTAYVSPHQQEPVKCECQCHCHHDQKQADETTFEPGDVGEPLGDSSPQP